MPSIWVAFWVAVLALRVIVPVVLAVALGSASPASAPAAGIGARGQEHLVVGLRAPIGAAAEAELAARAGTLPARRLRRLRALRVGVDPARRDAALRALRADPRVAFAEVDRPIRLDPPRRLGPPIAGLARTPDDKGFHYEHAMSDGKDHDIDATQAWSRRTSCAKVAVLDTGVDTDHPDLKSNIWTNPGEVSGNGRDDDHDGYVDDVHGVDLVRGHGSGVDRNGHGTHVAGIIGARGDNERGVAGVCWKAQIVPIRFMDANGEGSSSAAAEGIAYAVAMGAHVINASYGADAPNDIEQRAIDQARAAGVMIVVAAGNDGHGTATYPAAYPEDNIISVAATDEHDHLAGFSNYNATSVDLGAPGTAIASTWDDGDYREASGTSMAAPFVAGAAAMLRAAAHPGLASLRKLLLESVDADHALRGKTVTGGRLNLDRALHRAGGS